MEPCEGIQDPPCAGVPATGALARPRRDDASWRGPV